MSNRNMKSIAVASLLLGFCLIFLPQANHAQQRTIAVIGEGVASGSPETVALTLSISSQDATASTVFAKQAVAVNNLKSALRDAGISESDITDGMLAMNPTYDYSQPNQSPKLVGYHLMTPLTIRVGDMNALPRLLDLAAQAGASGVTISEFGMKKGDVLRDRATADALRDALERAESLAKQIGASLGDIQSVSDLNAPDAAREIGGSSRILEKRIDLKVVYALK